MEFVVSLAKLGHKFVFFSGSTSLEKVFFLSLIH